MTDTRPVKCLYCGHKLYYIEHPKHESEYTLLAGDDEGNFILTKGEYANFYIHKKCFNKLKGSRTGMKNKDCKDLEQTSNKKSKELDIKNKVLSTYFRKTLFGNYRDILDLNIKYKPKKDCLYRLVFGVRSSWWAVITWYQFHDVLVKYRQDIKRKEEVKVFPEYKDWFE